MHLFYVLYSFIILILICMSFGVVFLSDCFFTNRVKHDGILSLFLFNVFIYDLLAKLAKLNVIYCVGHYFMVA